MSDAAKPVVVRNVETEYLDINAQNAWAVLFQHINTESQSQSVIAKHTCIESKKPQNKNLNRYRDVSPYDHSRVILQSIPCDYINANTITMAEANRKYILTQGPLEATSGHFWLMTWEQNSTAVIMLNKIVEKDQIKCYQYWPLTTYDSRMVFAEANLEVECLSVSEKSDYRTSTLRLTNLRTRESREILHFHYTTWPDFGVPQSPMAFLRFLRDVRASGVLDSTVGPSIVHCSAGIGRSGTFCLVDTCLVLIEKNGLNSVDVRSVLVEMRGMRMGLIQTPDQLRFSYIAIIEGYKQSSNLNLDNNDESLINHYDIVSNDISNNSSLEEEDEPPPLPPPRGDSLTRSMMADLTPSPVSETENGTGPPNKPLPMEPAIPAEIRKNSTPSNSNSVYDNNTNSTNNSDFTPNASSSNDVKNEVRHRQQDKKDRLAAQVREMKRRQEQMEDWQKLKRSKSENSPEPETVHEESESG